MTFHTSLENSGAELLGSPQLECYHFHSKSDKTDNSSWTPHKTNVLPRWCVKNKLKELLNQGCEKQNVTACGERALFLVLVEDAAALDGECGEHLEVHLFYVNPFLGCFEQSYISARVGRSRREDAQRWTGVAKLKFFQVERLHLCSAVWRWFGSLGQSH